MLRGILGDGALGQALRSYNPALDREPSYFQRTVQSAHAKSLEWFFDDWIYRDRGLPDLDIANVYTRALLLHGGAKKYLTSVEVRNDGSCAAQVPVSVQTIDAQDAASVFVPAQGKATVRVVMQNPAQTITVNDGTVPEVGTAEHQTHIADAPAQ